MICELSYRRFKFVSMGSLILYNIVSYVGACINKSHRVYKEASSDVGNSGDCGIGRVAQNVSRNYNPGDRIPKTFNNLSILMYSEPNKKIKRVHNFASK